METLVSIIITIGLFGKELITAIRIFTEVTWKTLRSIMF